MLTEGKKDDALGVGSSLVPTSLENSAKKPNYQKYCEYPTLVFPQKIKQPQQWGHAKPENCDDDWNCDCEHKPSLS